MKIEVLRGFLRSKGFSIYKELYTGILYKKFAEFGMDIWADNTRIIVTKQYLSESQLDNWNEEEQPRMFMLFQDVSSRYKNNLYLFMLLDFEQSYTNTLLMKINKIEKNAEICKKYVLREVSDLNRIPFLTKDDIESGDLFNYEQSFKQALNSIQDISSEVRQAVNSYFEISENSWKDNILSVWKEAE